MLTVQAAALPEMGALYAKSAALYAANGQELYVYNADEQLQPASVTKIIPCCWRWRRSSAAR